MKKQQTKIKEIEVSVFHQIDDKVPKQEKLFDLWEQKKQDKNYLNLLEEIASKPTKEGRKPLKIKLVGIVPASKMKDGRTKEHVTDKNPIVFIDIDELDSVEESEECMSKLKDNFDKHILYLGLSASKKGVHMLIFIKDPDKHKEHERAIHEAVKELGYKTDQNTLNPIQRMFVGHVHTATINENPIPYSKKTKINSSEKRTSVIPINEETIKNVEFCINEIKKKEIDITTDRSIWIKLAFSLASLGEAGRIYFRQVSQYYPNYTEEECDITFDDCLKRFSENSIKIGTFFYYCKEKAGIKLPKKNSSNKTNQENQNKTLQRHESFLDQFEFRHNIVTGRTEIFDKEISDFKPMEERDYNSLYRKSWLANSRIPEKTLRTLLNSDYVPLFNPFTTYFNSLPEWDGKDYIDDLLSTVKTTNDELWKRFAKKWLVATVVSAIVDEEVNHTVLILVGSQGIGKTSWVEKLLPKELKRYKSSGRISPTNKDTLIFLSECLLLFMDELAGLSKSDMEDYKEIITKPNVRIRRPYGYFSENLPHRASFIASINDLDFIRDTTGDRRFLSFEVESIDYTHKINMDKVYSQAMHLFRTGFKYWFNDEEQKELKKHNDQFRSQTIEEQQLLHCFTPCEEEYADIFLQSGKITEHLVRNLPGLGLSNIVIRNVGRALRKNEFLRLHKNQRWVFALKINDVKENKDIEEYYSDFLARNNKTKEELEQVLRKTEKEFKKQKEQEQNEENFAKEMW